MWKYLFNTKKLAYVKGDKPKVECILCGIVNNDPKVKNLELWRDDTFIITVNLYPYNAGHIMIFPHRHIDNIKSLTDEEALKWHKLLKKSIEILEEEFTPSGFNIGFNMGKGSGESITHIHQHIVPRYGNEPGFIDVISGTRLLVSDPEEVLNTLKKRFSEISI